MIIRIAALFCLATAVTLNHAVESVPAKYQIIQNKDIVEVLKADGHFTRFLAVVQDANMTEMLRERGPFTIFAPTDEAFKKVLTFPAMQQDQTRLISIVKNHIVMNHIYSSDEIATLKTITVMNGNKLTVTASNSIWQINNAHAVRSNLSASNGVVYGIDTVLGASDFIANSGIQSHLPEPDDFVSNQ